MASKNSKPVAVSGSLREEVEYWRFLDNWKGFAPWRSEKHLQITLATDSSLYKWGAVVWDGASTVEFGDYWDTGDKRPIHLKEANALLNALIARKTLIIDHRVDVFVDNLPLVHDWEGQKGKDPELNNLLKAIFQVTVEGNVDLRLSYIPSADNPADAPSRAISLSHSMLSPMKWLIVQEHFGPHSVDLMALDSNVMGNAEGVPLRHFTPFPTPMSAGVNVFAQNVALESNSYVLPPFNLVFPLLRLLRDQQVERCTIVFPCFEVRPVWWPCLWTHVVEGFILARKGDSDAILYPSKGGFVTGRRSLQWDLWVARLTFA